MKDNFAFTNAKIINIYQKININGNEYLGILFTYPNTIEIFKTCQKKLIKNHEKYQKIQMNLLKNSVIFR